MRYNEIINQYYDKSSHIGSFDFEDLTIGTGLVGAPACGDVMKLQIKVENNIIVDAKILVFGCGSAKASSSFAVEMLIGKNLDQASTITNEDIAEKLGLPKIKMHCSVLAAGAIKRAIEDYKNKNNANNSSNSSNNNNDTKTESVFFNISDSASAFIAKVLSKVKEETKGIRLTLEEGSCGLSYKIRYVKKDTDTSTDILFEKGSLKIFVSKDISSIVNGTTMDYKQDGLNSGIVFTNPNEVGRCGCGINFRLEDTPVKDDSDCCNQ
jgi:nitrogen fixation NifU-like protein